MRYVVLTIIFLFLALVCYPQLKGQPYIDSVVKRLSAAGDDTNKVNLLTGISFTYNTIDTRKGISYASQGLQLAERLNWQKGISNIYNSFGANNKSAGNYSSALAYYFKSLNIERSLSNSRGIARAYKNIANVYWPQLKYDSALKYYFLVQKIYVELNDNAERAKTLSNIGGVYLNMKDYAAALDYELAALKIYEKTGKEKETAAVVAFIAKIYESKSDLPNALIYYFRAQKIYEKIHSELELADVYLSIGGIYETEANFETALSFYLRSLENSEKANNEIKVASTLNSISIIYKDRNNIPAAIASLERALRIYEKLGLKVEITATLANMGITYFDGGNYIKGLEYDHKALKGSMGNSNQIITDEIFGSLGQHYCIIIQKGLLKDIPDSLFPDGRAKVLQTAIEYLKKGVKASQDGNNRDGVMEYSKSLAEAYARNGNYKAAWESHILFANLHDSVFSQSNNAKLTAMEVDKKTELMNKDLDLKNKQIALDKLSIDKKRNERGFYIAGMCLLAVAVILILKNVKDQKKTNKLLANEKEQINVLKNEVERKHKEVLDSVNYSVRIQNAILPAREEIAAALGDSFILFKPKDIVSGDFYWFSKKDNKIILAAVDCTGHGVPGAFMSMIGNTLLNEIVNEKNTTTPGNILKQLDEAVNSSLKQNKDGAITNDGMDAAIIMLDIDSNEVCFAGANRPLYHYTEDEHGQTVFKEYKPDKFAIGGSGIHNKKAFKTHSITVNKDDALYIFTDGYADQFGGDKGKKLMTAKFKEMLLAIQDKNMMEQQRYLNEYFERWKGDQEQVDDVLVIGVKI